MHCHCHHCSRGEGRSHNTEIFTPLCGTFNGFNGAQGDDPGGFDNIHPSTKYALAFPHFHGVFKTKLLL